MEVVPGEQKEGSAEVTVKSDIVKTGEEAQNEASGQLLSNLRRMVNEPAFSDVVFLCNDGERVEGCRILLSGMSDVLKSMFMNGMAESTLAEITLPEISSPVLLSVLEFLYTGTLLDYRPPTWRIACEVIIASRFFLLPNLEKITRILMHAQTVSVAEDLPKVASLLTEAVRFKVLYEEPDANLGELVTILSPNLSNSNFLEHLSEDAFDYLLGNSKSSCENDDKLSFGEYLRFKQVIRWVAYESGCHETPSRDQFVDSIVPPEKEALSLCIDSYNCSSYKVETLQADSAWHNFLQDGVKHLRQAASRLASNIDCRRIHPILLAKVVEPMKIISAEQIMTALWFHSFRRITILSRLKCGWKHGGSYSVIEQGYKIQKNAYRNGVAVATLPMSRPYGVYQWRFVLEEGTGSFYEFGFVPFGVPDEEGGWLSDHSRARVLRILWNGSVRVSIEWKDGCGRGDWKALEPTANLTAFFNYNASEHTCSLSLGGKEYGSIWKNIPIATYYPAVCLGDTFSGRARIELVSGFDIL